MSEKRKLEEVKSSGSKRKNIQTLQRTEESSVEKKRPVDVSVPLQVPTQPGPSTRAFPTACGTVEVDDNDQYAKDREHLLNVFPEEVWSLVFDKLESPNQMKNVSDSSLFIQELLLPRRQEFLFENVWKIMKIKYKNSDVTGCLKQALKLRLVCRLWCTAIDNFYESLPFHFEMLQKAGMPGFKDFTDITWALKSSARHRNGLFCSYFCKFHGGKDQHRNPLIGRSISILLEEEHSNFKSLVKHLLNKCGHHIWYCKLYTTRSLEDYPYLRIRDVLGLMPNLKVLHIEAGLTQREVFCPDIPSNPLPTLEHLQMLRCKGLPCAVFEELVRCYNHIRSLDIQNQVAMPIGEVSSSLCNLSKLGITFSTFIFEQFRGHASLSSKLTTKLYLSFRNGPSPPWKTIYETLDSKSEKLKFIHLDLPYPEIRQEDYFSSTSYDGKPHLAHLSNLELKVNYLILLDILLPIKNSLTTFNLLLDLQGKQMRTLSSYCEFDRGINVYECAHKNRPLKLNIWSVFPKLKRFTFKYSDDHKSFIWSCSRQEWSLHHRALRTKK